MKFKAHVHYEIAYCDVIEAEDEFEAQSKIRELAMNAPMTDWEWLEEMGCEANEVEED